MARWQELLAVWALLILSLPFRLLTAGLLLAHLGRPLMFRQARVGQGGRAILVPKFRTMSEARGPDGQLLPDAQRQTPVSGIVRRLRLDELPQLDRIIAGDMALVGPRPLLESTLRGFGALGVIRNSVRPGLTGWAQVSGNTRLNDDEKLALDLWYVAHRSPGLDLRILCDTLGVALRGEHRHEERLRRAQAWLRDQQTAVPPEMEMAGAMS